jgi:hypothetical protein
VSRLAPALLVLLLAIPVSPQLVPPDICNPQRVGEPDDHYRRRRLMGNCDMQDKLQRDAQTKWNKERQAKLKADTDKLLELSTQLKQQVDKSNEHILSLDVIKKAEEIEKLAKSVREKMKADGY